MRNEKPVIDPNERRIIDLANVTLLNIQSGNLDHTEALRQHICAVDVFHGVYRDPELPKGFGFVTIKGTQLLATIAAGNSPREVKMGALVFTCVEEALAAQRTLGENPDAILP